MHVHYSNSIRNILRVKPKLTPKRTRKQRLKTLALERTRRRTKGAAPAAGKKIAALARATLFGLIAACAFGAADELKSSTAQLLRGRSKT